MLDPWTMSDSSFVAKYFVSQSIIRRCDHTHVEGDTMEDPIDLEKLESSAFRAYFEDGMFDIFFGLMFILGGLRTITDEPAFSLLILVAVLVPVLGKRAITYPRLGRVKFREHRVKGLFRIMLVTVILVLVSAAIVGLHLSTDLLEGRLVGDLVFGAMFIGITLVMGQYFEYPLLVVHGVIFAIIALCNGLLEDDAAATVALIGGSISIIIGLTNLATFLRKYPTLSIEV